SDFERSIYDDNEQLFGAKERDALISDALPFGAQALIKLSALPRPTLQYGLSMTRYNRIEGFSTGFLTEQQVAGGYSGSLMAPIGVADREPNAELSLSRSNLSSTISLTGYNRLVSANDWGNPLSFGSSISALLWGRDEGFYYRASGMEVGWKQERGAQFDWRLFAEQERTAEQRTTFSLAHASHGAEFQPNILARKETFVGSSMRVTTSHGLDPQGTRLFTDLRAEAAASDSAYGRAALDLTVTQGFGQMVAGALTLSGGSSIGAVPAQRRWYLGGTQTIRGEAPDTAHSGNAFWMTRAEVGVGLSSARPVLFSDFGWVGDREHLDVVGRPMSGVGVGSSFMDGLIRFDVARGIYPRKQWRVDMYVDAKF